MTKHFTLGEDIFFEIKSDGQSFMYKFKKDRLDTKFEIEENYLVLGEEVNALDYKKFLGARIYKFIKSLKK